MDAQLVVGGQQQAVGAAGHQVNQLESRGPGDACGQGGERGCWRLQAFQGVMRMEWIAVEDCWGYIASTLYLK